MTETEQNLRSAMNNLILMIGLNERMKQSAEAFEALMAVSNYEKRIFEQPVAMAKFSDAKESLYAAFDAIKGSFGKITISEAYDAFKIALADMGFCKEAGFQTALTSSETAALFNAVFDRMTMLSGELPDDTDGYTLLIHLIWEIRHPKDTTEAPEEVCPYCEGVPSRIPKADFFGANCDDSDGFVWACECGAYAYMSKDGAVIGRMADTDLHHKRKNLKRLLFELCGQAGLTVYEGCKWIAWITGSPVNNLSDIESLMEEDCDAVLSAYEKIKLRIRALKPDFPHTHGELMRFLENGGRMMAQNAFGYKYGRMFVPIKIGKEGIRVRHNKKVQEIMLPKNLDYSFEGSQKWQKSAAVS